MRNSKLITGGFILAITLFVIGSLHGAFKESVILAEIESEDLQVVKSVNDVDLLQSANDTDDTSKKKSVKKTANKKKNKKNEQYKLAGQFKITAYCSCSACCGKSNGITASGTRATAGRTIAADTSRFSFGTKVKIGDNVYTVEDRGSAIHGNKIDVYCASHSEALRWGVRYCDVYVQK